MNKKEAGREIVRELVERFRANYSEFTASGSKYNETALRSDFLNPFLQALGWDVFNDGRLPQHLREVIFEDTVDVEDEHKKPDYALRVGGERKCFIEAKKPSVDISTDKKPAFQVRRYGWHAGMAISVLTNFDKLIIYDCLPLPRAGDDVRIARIKHYTYSEYIDKFDEIYDQFSRESVYSGNFDKIFPIDKERAGAEPFDHYFLEQIESWRKILSEDLINNNTSLSSPEINFLIQRLINRIVFLRICEDRDLEKYEDLKQISTYDDLKALFLRADKKYNSGLFDFLEDGLSLKVHISDKVLIDIFRELYYPESPYLFSVVESSILGEIYEMFLAREISILADKTIVVIEKPEVVESSGVVATPQYIVDKIVDRTLGPLCYGKSPDELSRLRVADICCGSGPFLLASYDYLLNLHLEWYLRDGAANHRDEIYGASQDVWHLTLHEKQRILLNNIFGVDIDIRAVEVARFSLLLKVLEDESAGAIESHFARYNSRALPNLNENIKCGNSLVDSTYFDYDEDSLTSAEQMCLLNPFDWDKGFADVSRQGGFDAIVGNPPYIRIQNMVKYAPEEVGYYKSDFSPFTCGKNNNFDKYYLFVERSLSLLNPSGRLGYIVPHKFFTIKAGVCLRKLIASNKYLSEIIHFGVQQIFRGRRTYTCILILSKEMPDAFSVEHVRNVAMWKYKKAGLSQSHAATDISGDSWVFVPPEVESLFDRLNDENPAKLNEVADIFVGVQTSADDIYIIHPTLENETYVRFTDINGKSRVIEKAILRPSLLDVGLLPFGSPAPNTYMIFPYKIVEKKAEVYTQAELSSDFPLCWIYLSSFKKQLLDRSIMNYTEETWYRFGRSQSLTKFDGSPKLIWPVLSLEPRYAYDDENIIMTGGGNGPYYAMRPKTTGPFSLFYLQAIVSHPVIEAMIRARASKFQGGYASHGKQFIKDVPIRNVGFGDADEANKYNKIIELVQKLIEAVDTMASASLPQHREVCLRQCALIKDKVMEIISDLYGITPEDLALINDFNVATSESEN